MSYYHVGLSFDSLLQSAKKGLQSIESAAVNKVRAEAKQGALDASPEIRTTVRKEVLPYITAAIGMSAVALFMSLRR